MKETAPTLEWQGTSDINLMSVMDSESVGSTVKRLHRALFEGKDDGNQIAASQA